MGTSEDKGKNKAKLQSLAERMLPRYLDTP
jgi:hypothetical protein